MNASRSKILRALVVACASLAMIGGAQAQGHSGRGGYGGHWGGGGYHEGYHGGYHRGGGGWGWGGVGLGLGLGFGLGLSSYYGYPYYAPGYVVVDPGPTYYVDSQPVPAAVPSPAAPVIYPRNGQSPAQQDADGNACSQWAGKQANATVDPNVFQRGMAACMDARGYTVR